MEEVRPLISNLSQGIEMDEQELSNFNNENNAINNSDIYKRLGFNTAITECGNKYELDRLILNNKATIEFKTKAIQERFNERIAWHETILKDLHEKFNKENGSNDIKLRLDEVRKSLQKAVIDLGKDKRDLFEKRLDLFSEEIQKLITSQSKAYNEWYKLSQQMYNDSKVGLDIIRIRAEQFRDYLQKRLETIEEQLISLDGGGTNYFVIRFLLGSGIALAAGWFFSVYLLIVNNMSTDVGKVDVWFFLLKCLITSLNSNPWIAVFQVLLGILAVFLTAYFSNYMLSKMNSDNNNETIALNIANEINELEDETEHAKLKSFRYSIRTDSFFGLYLHAMPVLIGLGVLFIILKMGLSSPDADIEKLHVSIAGQFIGTVVAYSLGNMTYILLAKLTDLKKLYWIHFIILFILFTTPILFWFYNEAKQIAMIGFALCIFLAAIPLAFGFRYRGLLQSLEQINQGLGACSYYIKKYSSPRPIGIHSELFRQKFKEIQTNLLNWIDDKNQAIKAMQEMVTLQEIEKTNGIWWKTILKRGSKLKSLLNGNNSDLTKDGHSQEGSNIKYLELNSFEKQNFPEHDKLISTYLFEYGEIRSQFNSFSKLLAKLESDIENTMLKVFSLRRDQTHLELNVRFTGLCQENFLREGFELGLWYIENKSILPNRICPPIYHYPTVKMNAEGSHGDKLIDFSINKNDIESNDEMDEYIKSSVLSVNPDNHSENNQSMNSGNQDEVNDQN
jgi:hypothetical protein